MANIERVSDQLRRISDGFDNSNHTFVTRLLNGLQSRIGETVVKIETAASGKQAVVGRISVNIIGSKISEDAEQLEADKQKIRQMIDTLKNPSALIEILGE